MVGTAGMVLGVLLLACCLWSSFIIAARLTVARPAGDPAAGDRKTSTAVRWSAAAVIAYWLLVAFFHLLSAAHAFRLIVALPLWLVVASGLHWRLARQTDAVALLRSDLAAVAALLGSLFRTRLIRWLLIGAILVIATRLLRGLVAPPLAWDSLTYHLLRAGRWVQLGGVAAAAEAAPDAWGYYEYYPLVGDLLWAWAMLPASGDALLAPAGLLVWLSCLLGVYAASREVGATPRVAALAGLAVCMTPAAANYLTGAYVNNTVLALFVLACVFVARLLRGGSTADAALAIGALSVAAGVQVSAAPFLLLGGAAVLVAAARRGLGARERVLILAAAAVAAMIVLPGYLRSWVDKGSPTYPFELKLGRRTIFAGNEENVALLSGRLFPESDRRIVLPHFLGLLFEKKYYDGWEHLNLSPASPLLALLGLLGAVRLLWRPGRRPLTLFLLASASVVVLGLMSESMTMQRTQWAPVVGRFLTPTVAALAVLGASAGLQLSQAVLAVVLAVNTYYAVPLGWSDADLNAMARAFLPLAGGLALGLELLLELRRRGRPIVAIAAAATVVLAVASYPLTRVREESRYRIYAAAAMPFKRDKRWERSFDVHGIALSFASSWPIWKQLDDGPHHRIAVTAGWEGVGHNWYRYPLLGSRLQNQVVYVPVTNDGNVIDYRLGTKLRERADRRAWIERLVRADVDHVVTLPPFPLEESWIRDIPRVFRITSRGTGDHGHAYRFDRAAALAWLAAAPLSSPPAAR